MYELEVRELCPAIARVFGPASSPAGYRLAPDEQLMLGDDAVTVLGEGNPNAVDVSSEFTCLELSGDGWEDAFNYLSDVDLPSERPALIQGHIADIGAKAIVGTELLCLIPANYAHHVRSRILELSGVGFAVREVSLERAPA